MRLEVDLTARHVVVCGTAAGAHRAVRRYAAAGAVVTAAVAGDLPGAEARVPGVGYETLPADDDLAGWVNLLRSAWLVVAVGPEAARNERLAGVCGHLRVLLASEPAGRRSGQVTLVGGGPGTSRLLTVEACDALREADVVFYDRLGPTDDLPTLAPGAELVDVGKRPYHHPVSQADIEQQMVERALSGASVVRLKGGDPFVFGRGGEELIACARAGVEVRVVPGVSSAISVPGAAGIPLTHRGVSRAFTVISGHDPLTPDQTRALAQLDSTVVILMGMNNLRQITAMLLRSGLASDTPAAVVERGFSDRQRTVVATVSSLVDVVRSSGLSSPAVVVIGAVVAVAAQHSFGSSQTADPDAAPLLADGGLASLLGGIAGVPAPADGACRP